MRHLDKERTAPDILDCIANLSSDEVFTPPRLANQMLNLLPKDVWANPDLKWLDPGTKTGVFLREIARRLMDGLSVAIPDEDARREHIYKNMLFGLPITELTSLLARRSVYYSKNADHEHYAVVRMGSEEGNIPLVDTKHTFDSSGSCTSCGAPESLERGGSRENYAYPFIHQDQLPGEIRSMKFDVIVGNPPYQIGTDGNTRDRPIYNLFVEAAIDMGPKYVLMIVPSRWFAGGLGLDGFRARMLNDRRIRKIVDYPEASECFPGVEIKSGVNYFLWEREYAGDAEVTTKRAGTQDSTALRSLNAYDVFVRDNEAIGILEKVRSAGEVTLDKVVAPSKPFGLQSNYVGADKASAARAIELYGTKRTSWVAASEITMNEELIDAHKVLVSRAYGGGNGIPHQVIGRPIVVGPGTACTLTYLAIGNLSSALEAQNLAAYLQTRFVRFLVSLRKITQDTKPSSYAFVPMLDMSNTAWTDEALFSRYNLTEDEILFIKSQIKEMP